MTTDTAQRRLLEALSELQLNPTTPTPSGDELAVMAAGLQMACATQLIASHPEVSRYYAAMADLCLAVRDDLATKENV